MIDAIFERLDMPVQHRRVARDALAVEFFVNRDPVRARYLVRTDLRARLFAENLGCAAVDVIQPGIFERLDDVRERQAMALGHVLDFGGGEERELNVRQRFLEAAHQRQPVVERKLARIVPADDVDLIEVRAGLHRLGEDLVRRHPEDPFRFLELIRSERAELARGKAHVGRVDVTVENVIHVLAALAFLLIAREPPERMKIGRTIEREPVGHRKRRSRLDFAPDLDQRRILVCHVNLPVKWPCFFGSNSTGAPAAAKGPLLERR